MRLPLEGLAIPPLSRRMHCWKSTTRYMYMMGVCAICFDDHYHIVGLVDPNGSIKHTVVLMSVTLTRRQMCQDYLDPHF